MKKKELFIIITSNKYPTGDAGSVRLHSFAKIMYTLGYEVFIIGMGDKTGFQKRVYEEITYISLRYSQENYCGRVLGRLFYKKNLIKVIKKVNQPIDGILIDSGSDAVFNFIKQYAKKNDIPLFYDAVEWYSPCEFKNGERNLAYKKNDYLNRELIDGSYKVISISTYLENHFLNRGIKTMRIPVIMDISKIDYNKKCNAETINIVYAGSIGGKDHISELIDAISLLEAQELKRIKFFIIGITREEYEKKYEKVKDNLLNGSVNFIGRVDRKSVLKYLKDASVAFLLRPDGERYAKAGFPTKVVEALATGTPMLCNYTSDLNLYLRDGENSIRIENCSVEACTRALKQLLAYSDDRVYYMSKSARATAEKYFDWRLYIERFKNFISDSEVG